jgi:hypothetical protein
MAHVDIGSGDRPPVLEQEGEIRTERGQQRTAKTHADGQRDAGHCGTVFPAFVGAGALPPAVGEPLPGRIGGGSLSIRIAFTEERGFLFMRPFFAGTRLRARKHARGFIQH